jgi:hypothetical protein
MGNDLYGHSVMNGRTVNKLLRAFHSPALPAKREHYRSGFPKSAAELARDTNVAATAAGRYHCKSEPGVAVYQHTVGQRD